MVLFALKYFKNGDFSVHSFIYKAVSLHQGVQPEFSHDDVFMVRDGYIEEERVFSESVKTGWLGKQIWKKKKKTKNKSDLQHVAEKNRCLFMQ